MTAHAARDPFRLDDARALVTGASRGIGASVARSLARAGADLALTARTVKGLESTGEAVAAQGRKAHLIPGDFAAPAAAEQVVDQAAEALGGLDIVVHCAGVLPVSGDGSAKVAPIDQTTAEEWGRVTSINLDATVSLCRAARPHLLDSTRASLVLMSSVAGLVAVPGMEAYGVTKAAQISLTRSLAVGWARDGVRVNAVSPGWVRTEMIEFATSSPALSDWLMAHVPSGEWISPDDVANGVLYLASPASARVTGHTLVIDGALSVPDGGLAGIPKPPSPFSMEARG
jgi:NAD(P)-dependent dehydrogenase (short-subunit alcohol dehydrogenase family)